MLNIVSIAVLYRIGKRRKTPIYVTQISLNVINILQTIPSQILLPAACYYRKWIWGPAVCSFEAFWTFLLAVTSVNILVLLAWQYRTIIKCKTKYITSNKSIFMELQPTIYGLSAALLWTVLPFFGWGRFGIEGIGVSCALVWHLKDSLNRSFVISSVLVAFVGPVCIMIAIYTSLYRSVKKRRVRISRRTQRKRSQIGEKSLMKLGVAMTVAFFLSWSPYALVATFTMLTPRYPSPLVLTIPSIFAKLSVCFTPVVYYCTQINFRLQVHAFLGKKKQPKDAKTSIQLTTFQQKLITRSRPESSHSRDMKCDEHHEIDPAEISNQQKSIVELRSTEN